MKYESTRGGSKDVFSAEAIITGIAPDGGLYVPKEKVSVDLKFIEGLVNDTYQERAKKILSLFLSDYTYEELSECVDNAYGDNFSSAEITPIVKLNDQLHVLELWHGPTCAF